MTIYKLFDDSMRYASFRLDLEDFLDLLDPSIGEQAAMRFSQSNTALAAHWRPLNLALVNNEGSENRAPDIGLWRGATLILSPKALRVLAPLINNLGELLPLELAGKDYALFNCLTEVDADRAISSRIEEKGYFMEAEKLAFPPSLNKPIFKSPFENNRNLFCTEAFKAVVESNNLGGVYFGKDLTDFI